MNIEVLKIKCIRETPLKYGSIQTQVNAAKVIRDFIGDSDRENFVVLLLNQKNEINGINLVSVGTLTTALVHPREVFKAAILANAACIIIGHNHPSGDTEPSKEDFAMTKQLKAAGKLLGIPVLDHVIVGYDSIYSFNTEGTL